MDQPKHVSATRLEMEEWIRKSVPVLGDAGRALEALIRDRDDLLKALVRSQFVLVNLREHARHIRTCDAPEHPCTCELDELLEQSIEVVHGSTELIAKAGGQELPHFPRLQGDLLAALKEIMGNAKIILRQDPGNIFAREVLRSLLAAGAIANATPTDSDIINCTIHDARPLLERLRGTVVDARDAAPNGNYEHGMANGLIWALHIMEGSEGKPVYEQGPPTTERGKA